MNELIARAIGGAPARLMAPKSAVGVSNPGKPTGSAKALGWGELGRETIPLMAVTLLCIASFCLLDVYYDELTIIEDAGALLPGVLRNWGGKVAAWVAALSLLLAIRSRFRTSTSEGSILPRLVGAVIPIACLAVVLTFFGAWKASYTAARPFAYDIAFMNLDRTLHFGRDPWVLLHEVLGSPFLTTQIDIYYAAWYLVFLAAVLWLSWTRDRVVRLQFFLSLLITLTVAGAGLAHLFPSAGPAFFERVTPPGTPNPYAPLMAHLSLVSETNSLAALWLQEQLWERYAGEGGWVEGIAAFPSMHVAFAILWALAVFRLNRVIGATLWIYVFVILVGSVYTGFHYAVDGYAMLIFVPLLWWVSGLVARKWSVQHHLTSQSR